MKKRGIVPEAIKQFVFSQGISKVESTVDFSIVEAFNRKILDPKAKRYFFVSDPVKLIVEDAPKRKINLKLHPTKDMGERSVETDSVYFVQSEDMQNMKIGDVFRLKGLYNVTIQKTGDEISGRFEGEELLSDTAKIQWTTKNHIEMEISVPGPLFNKDVYNQKSLTKLQGYAEKAVSDIPDGEIIQFERVGFVRIEKQKKKIVGYFSHK